MATATDSTRKRLVLGGRARLQSSFAGWVASVKGADPLREVVVVTSSNLACGYLSRSLADRLGAHAAVRFLSINALARELVSERLGAGDDSGGLRALSPLLRERLVAALAAKRAGTSWYFEPVARTPGLPRALLRTIDDLREAGVPVGALAALRSRKGGDLAALYGDYVAALQRRRLADDAAVYTLAAEAAACGAAPARAGVPVAVFGLYDLPAMQEALVAALAGERPFAAFVPCVPGVEPFAARTRAFFERLGLEADGADDGGAVSEDGGGGEGSGAIADPRAHADSAAVADAPAGVPARPGGSGEVGQLSLDLGQAAGPAVAAAVTVPASRPGTTTKSDSASSARARPAAQAPGAHVRIVSVADDVAERRAVVAAVLEGASHGIAFYETAVVAPDQAGRDRLGAALRAHGVPVAARGADDGVAVRTCRLLLDCVLPLAGRPLRRDAVIDLAATAPRMSDAPDTTTLALWDELSRRARVVADDEWRDRLWRLRRSLATSLDRGDDDQTTLSEAAACASLDAFVGRLAGLRRRLTAARTWPQATAILVDAARRLCGVAADDPALRALAEVADVALVDDGGPIGSFAVVARRALSLLERPSAERVGRDGTAVLSPHQVRGLSFRLVVFCDLAEGGFPPRPAPDPVLLDRERTIVAESCGARLPTSAELPAEHDALFALARAAADERLVLVAPRLDASTGRPRLPSRALLALARELAGRSVRFEELETDGGLDGVVRRVPGGLGEPVDLRDVDVRALVQPGPRRTVRPAWLGPYAARVMGAGRAERGAAAAVGRRRPALGPHDGVLSAANAARAAEAVFAAPVSPSAFESYLSCPFGFYLRYVLGLEVPDEPDEALSIEPVDLGSVAHEILQGAYAAAAGGTAPTRERVLACLDDAAQAVFARAEARGLTGFPLSWRVVADELLTDLRRVVSSDPSWTDGLLPDSFEWSFGAPRDRDPARPASGPAPELLVDGRLVRFRGRVDRIDTSPDGRRVRLVDYKTGRGATEAERVKEGRDVQLAVYVLALLAARGRALGDVAAEYRMVRRHSGFRNVALPQGADEVRERLTSTLAVAVSGIEGGFFPRLPQRGCTYCDAVDACGVDRIGFAVKADDPRLRALLEGEPDEATASDSGEAP